MKNGDSRVELGQRLRDVRQARGMTLKDLDRLSGLSSTHISEIERGKTSPTIGALIRLAQALGREPSYFLEPQVLPEISRMRSDRREARLLGPATAMSLTQGIPGGRLDATMLHMGPGDSPLVLSEGEGSFAGYLLGGRLRVDLDGRVLELETGDSIYFRMESPTTLTPLGTEPVELFIIATAPLATTG